MQFIVPDEPDKIYFPAYGQWTDCLWQLTWEPNVAASFRLKVNTGGMAGEEEDNETQTYKH